jgi:ferric-dicitrate binding protein FerR (iron transport regulator)
LVCGLAFLGQNYRGSKEPAAKIIARTAFKNQSKQVKKVDLSDGSRVWLQDNSRLVIADDFGKATRQVILTGEAFFDVAKDKTRPFIIYSQEVTTRVVGTSFNIKAYEKDATVEVSVVSGKVSVQSPDRLPAITGTAAHKPGVGMQVLLTPNQKVTYLKNGHHLVKKEEAEQGRRMVWAKTSLSFKDTPIRQIINKLNDHFATNIKLANEDINNCSIQGDFTNQNLLEILDVICNSIEADYKLYKNEIIISGEGCPLVKNQP